MIDLQPCPEPVTDHGSDKAPQCKTCLATGFIKKHECCEHAKLYFTDAEEAWSALAKFERQVLALANGLRGVERTLNRRPHAGRLINTTKDPL